jgi:hypothetical protein
VRAFVLGPPRDPDLLSDEDPIDSEAFPDDSLHGLTYAAAVASVDAAPDGRFAPFNQRFCVPRAAALAGGEPFFSAHYGLGPDGTDDSDEIEVPPNAPWRRLDDEWLYSAEMLALKLNKGINNTSLVLAFELPNSKKVLLFAGDAQRGNWLSWKGVKWTDGAKAITARDLLGRAVLYKVGHHGSHNATLAGRESDDYANLSWMATGAAAGEFTAMITAVNDWALTKNNPPWRHPLPSIKKALVSKAQGRVFQTDMVQLEKPENVSDASWQAFLDRTEFEQMYFDYTILDT